jgi:hypothetical protein
MRLSTTLGSAKNELFIRAEKGDAQAQYQLGLKYYQGEEVEKEIETALLWFQQAEIQRVVEAQPFIAKIRKEYEQLSLAELFMRAKKGEAQAQYLLGLRYYEGEEVEKDISMALEWLGQAVEQSIIEAQNLSVDIYQQRDYEQLSLPQLLNKAETGDTQAQYLLGVKYYQGKEVEKEIETALLWFQQAEIQGVVEAQPFIAKIRKEYEQLSLAELSMRAKTGEAPAQY